MSALDAIVTLGGLLFVYTVGAWLMERLPMRIVDRIVGIVFRV